MPQRILEILSKAKLSRPEAIKIEASYPSFKNKTTKGMKKISETIEFPKTFTVFGNLAVVLWIVIGSMGFWLVNQVAGWLFLVFALIGVYGVLKFLGCLRPCYQCKKCTFGLGRISALYFGKRTFKDPKESYGMTSAVFFYTLLGPFPAAFLLISTVQAFEALKTVVLLFLLTISFYSGLTWRTTRKMQNS
ncbi:MAG: hypothetical protein ABSA75_02980 [Candidatus Bathyarchaeia archaeon]|jgi:hypothetical protein